MIVFDTRQRFKEIPETAIVSSSGRNQYVQALDLNLKRIVGIKTVRLEGDWELKTAMGEVRALVRLAGRGISVPQIYSCHYDRNKKLLYLIMEHLAGARLSEKMDVSIEVFLGYVADIARTLEKCSQFNISHRDLKPDNIIIQDKRAYLIDFEISLSEPVFDGGSPGYQAPETLWPGISMERTRCDMFSLGVILYERLTGILPRPGTSYDVAGREFVFFIDPKEINPLVNKELNQLVTRLMQPDPKKRFKTYGEIADVIEELRRSTNEIN